jgi:hypothetical protein
MRFAPVNKEASIFSLLVIARRYVRVAWARPPRPALGGT